MSETKDYYKILGVDRNASEADIKKAFKKAALKYHPDRQNGKSDAEKKEAEEKFKEINEANDVLTDPQKKSNYDRFGSVDGPDMSGGFDPFGGFSSFFRGGNPFESRRPSGPEPGQTINLQVPVSIEEIFNGVHRTIDYTINVRCKHCNGEGGEGVETCPHCKGTGYVTETRFSAFGTIQNTHPCSHCRGTGKIVKNTCKECGGTGFKRENRKLNINFNPGVENGKQMKYTGAGYESKDKRGQNGDAIVTVVYNFDTNRYNVRGNTVYELVEIPYYDCIVGATREITLPNGKTVKYAVAPNTQDGNQITLHGYSINGGNYNIIVKVKLPDHTIMSKEEELLKEIQKLHN